LPTPLGLKFFELRNQEYRLSEAKIPKYTLEEYRKFIREAAPYISLIAGRKIKAAEADSMNDEELTRLALVIDERVAGLKKDLPFAGD
jgi:hypothetical protein